jgi:sec-independent protein translocase protein TatC
VTAPATNPNPVPEEDEVAASAAPLLDHLTELRSRLIVCLVAIAIAFAVCFVFSKQIFNLLIVPFTEAVKTVNAGKEPTLYFAPLEFFFTQVRLSVFAAIVAAFPVLAWQAYAFIAPGLYKREKKAAAPFLVAMPILFALGAMLVYFVMMPFIMRFAVGFEAQGAGAGEPAKFELLTRVGDYLSLVTTLILTFGFSFQLPVFLTLLARAGMVTAGSLAKFRRFAIVGIFIVAAILTPPDPFSQIVLGLCIIALYEISVVCVRMAEKKAKAAIEEVTA